jgi:hypothetical protein
MSFEGRLKIIWLLAVLNLSGRRDPRAGPKRERDRFWLYYRRDGGVVNHVI